MTTRVLVPGTLSLRCDVGTAILNGHKNIEIREYPYHVLGYWFTAVLCAKESSILFSSCSKFTSTQTFLRFLSTSRNVELGIALAVLMEKYSCQPAINWLSHMTHVDPSQLTGLPRGSRHSLLY